MASVMQYAQVFTLRINTIECSNTSFANIFYTARERNFLVYIHFYVRQFTVTLFVSKTIERNFFS